MKLSGIALNSILITVLGIFCHASAAQVSDFSDCRNIIDREDRYNCYDAIEANENTDNGVTTTSEEASEAVNSTRSVQPAQNQAADDIPVVRLPRSTPTPAPVPVEQELVESRSSRDQESEEIDDYGLENQGSASRIQEGEDGEKELVDTITNIRMISRGLQVLTLSSGQRWQQTETKRYFLKEGDEVRIYPSSWGSSYRLTSSRLRGFIQVRRVD